MRCFIAFFIVFLLLYSNIEAQISLRREYISSSKYHDENKNKNGGKGSMQTVHGNIQIPLSVKIDKNNRPTAWAVAAGGSYASLNNSNLSKDYCLSEILNTQIGIIHIRPISEKWSIMEILGAGWFTSELKHVSGRSILGQGGILFIKHAKPNLDWGIVPQERKRKHELKAIWNSIFYLVRTACQWRKLPKDYRKWELVYYYFRKWSDLDENAVYDFCKATLCLKTSFCD